MRLIMNKKGVFGYLGLRFVVNFNPFILGILITRFLFLQVYQKEHISLERIIHSEKLGGQSLPPEGGSIDPFLDYVLKLYPGNK